MKRVKTRAAFTMIELVFVIVVLGILAAIAVPKFGATRTDAQVSKGAADVAAIRSGIVSVRQQYLLRGQTSYPDALSQNTGALLFDGNGSGKILMYPIKPEANRNGHWSYSAGNYVYRVNDSDCTFVYDDDDGTFDLAANQDAICDGLVQ